MDRNIKYKQVCRVGLFGDDDINTSTNSQYIVYPSTINGITVNNGCSNYSASYTQIKIIGGGGSGAVATPTISGGVISSITMSNSGIGYTGQPNVIITSGLVNTSGLAGGTGYVAANTQITISYNAYNWFRCNYFLSNFKRWCRLFNYTNYYYNIRYYGYNFHCWRFWIHKWNISFNCHRWRR